MGVEKYGISTYGKTIVIDEGITEFSQLRQIYILANVLMLVGATIVTIKEYLTQRKSLYQPQRRKTASSSSSGGQAKGTLTPFFVAFMVNNLIRGAHMIDHICRPIYYYEPRWAYEKVWITEMEIPTYANVFIQGLGLLAILKVMKAVTGGGNRQSFITSLFYMALYVPASAFNLVHYTLEPPSNYGPFPNFNITGCAITTLPLVVLIVHAYRTYKPMGTELTEKLLKSGEDTETRRRSARLSSQARRRSKTPVKK